MKNLVLTLVVLATFSPTAFARVRAVRHPAEPCFFSVLATWGTTPVPAAGMQMGVVLVDGQTQLCNQWLSFSNVDWVTVESAPSSAQPSAFVTVAPNTTTAPRSTTLTVAGVALQLTQEAAPAIIETNLVRNGSFHTGISDWTWQDRFPNGFGFASWSPLDANGSPSSGSILLSDQGIAAYAFQRLQCIPVERSRPYKLGAKVRTSAGPEQGEPFIAFLTYLDADCSGSYTSIATHILNPTTPEQWQSFTFVDLTKSSTKAVLLVIGSGATVTSFESRFDDIVLEP